MTLVNAEFYFALRDTKCPEDKATAGAAAVLNRPFTKADAACVRDALEAAGSSQSCLRLGWSRSYQAADGRSGVTT